MERDRGILPRLSRVTVTGTAVLLVAFAAPVAFPARLVEGPPPVVVIVEGRPAELPPGATFGLAVQDLDLRPPAGDLLDVAGIVLRAGAFPGRVLLNGTPAAASTPLRRGDRITLERGRNRREPLVRVTTELPAGEPGNPQFYLGTSPGVQVITQGKYSGKLVSRVFRATGPMQEPLAVALTFDDGPWPGNTERILAILHSYHVKATFFVIGFMAQAYPDLVRAELAAGMAVGNHSWDHPNTIPFARLPKARIRSEIISTNRLLTTLGGNPTLFRPPGGSFSPDVVSIATRLGDRVTLWSVDPKDWMRGRTAAQITDAVLGAVRPGSIVEMHDGGGDRSATIAALPKIIEGLLHMGLTPVAILP